MVDTKLFYEVLKVLAYAVSTNDTYSLEANLQDGKVTINDKRYGNVEIVVTDTIEVLIGGKIHKFETANDIRHALTYLLED